MNEGLTELPNIQYQWGVFDCFTLANYMRFQISGDSLPDISWVYESYSEQSQPDDLVLEVVKRYCRQTDELLSGNLVVLEINGIMNLGTIHQGMIAYMGTNSGVYQRVERMSTYLNSIWIYDII